MIADMEPLPHKAPKTQDQEITPQVAEVLEVPQIAHDPEFQTASKDSTRIETSMRKDEPQPEPTSQIPSANSAEGYVLEPLLAVSIPNNQAGSGITAPKPSSLDNTITENVSTPEPMPESNLDSIAQMQSLASDDQEATSDSIHLSQPVESTSSHVASLPETLGEESNSFGNLAHETGTHSAQNNTQPISTNLQAVQPVPANYNVHVPLPHPPQLVFDVCQICSQNLSYAMLTP